MSYSEMIEPFCKAIKLHVRGDGASLAPCDHCRHWGAQCQVRKGLDDALLRAVDRWIAVTPDAPVTEPQGSITHRILNDPEALGREFGRPGE